MTDDWNLPCPAALADIEYRLDAAVVGVHVPHLFYRVVVAQFENIHEVGTKPEA